MSKVMKIAGKTDKSVVKGVRVSDNGDVSTTRTWETDVVPILSNIQLRSTTAVTNADNVFDASKYAFVSLRVSNSHKVDITLNFYEDTKDEPARWLADAHGNPVSYVVPSSDKSMIITPDDIPALSYLKNIIIRVAAKTAPTEGDTTIWIVGKR